MIGHTTPALSYLFRAPPPLRDGCDGSLVCDLAGSVPEFALLGAVLGLVAGLVALSYLKDAQSLVATERDEILAERAAFDSFADRVTTLTPTAPTPTAPTSAQTPPVTPATRTETNREADAILDAYRETVVALGHYDAAYGEPVTTNMAAELGTDVTTALQSAGGVSHPLRQTLVARAHTAAAQRQDADDVLETEADALESAGATYGECAETVDELDDTTLSLMSYGSLAETRTQLQGLEADCEGVLQERQRQIHDSVIETGREHVLGDSVSLPEYLYDSLDVSHPVLADGLSVLGTLQGARRHVEGELATR